MNTVKVSLAAAIAIGPAGGNVTPPPPSATLDSGITSFNGGGQRATGALVNVTVGPSRTGVTQPPRDPRVPTY